MSQVFTEYVRSLDASGEPPDAESFERIWAALGRALKSELRKRSLWSSPPSYLGIYGYDNWSQTTTEALEELLAGCYSHIFIRRLGGLKAQLRVKPNIEGLVFLGIRNFLHDTQKKHDPFGFRIFDVLRRALRAALATGELFLVGGDRKIRNDTVLAFDADTDPSEVDGEQLKSVAERWNDTLLPDLVVARGKDLERVIGTLRGLILRLPGCGVPAFTFQQLIDPLKNDARNRWSALLETEEGPRAIEKDGELTSLVRQIQPDTGIEDRDRFEKLSICLATNLDRFAGPARTRSYLLALWDHMRAFAVGSADGLPSARKLGQHLSIPRDRLPGLLETLGEMVQDCRAAISKKTPVNSLMEGLDRPPEGRHQGQDKPTTRRAS